MANGSTATAYTASAVAIVSGLTVSDWGVICGIAIGVTTFITNFIFRRRESKATLHAKNLEAEKLRIEIERQKLELQGVKMRKELRTGESHAPK
jgi:hypothetical protein